MEARRRLALLSSHLHPTIASSSEEKPTSQRLSALNCASSSECEKGNRESDCVFCRIIRGESPAVKIYEDDLCLCILDTNPVSRGHSLIIPKSHFPCLQETPPYVVGAMCSKVPFISNAVVKATSCDSFNLLVNNGASAGQVIFHTHLHIIPRKARDCLWDSESLPRRPLKLDQETSQLADQIRKELLFSGNSKDDEGQGSSLSVS
ncbi:adenylylsulfatase HINT3-like [Actinidia eriantha]|uniref:adenylylsulfatase HINT3-like n=1 Tax=Actinidia eriantha TaxID=165200 RepID=UPI00258F527A|nr:adenylylsulfatase HINT3-like [Actinidia eriantha]